MKKIILSLFFINIIFAYNSKTQTINCIAYDVNIITIKNGKIVSIENNKINKPYIQLILNNQNVYVKSNQGKTKLKLVGKNINNNFYFIETTSGGSINLYSLHLDSPIILTISKSYTILSNILNVQTLFKCY